jgi:chromate transporter
MNLRGKNTSLKELAGLFLKLGLTAFGGPAAHIAMMQKEVVDKRQWMDHAHFLDLIGATNLIPGPNSTEMAIHIGHERGGWKGLLVAGCCFIVPAVALTGIIAWAYRRFGALPQVRPFIYGIKPAIIAIILAAVFPLVKRAVKSVELGIIGILALTASLAGLDEVAVMFGAGLIVLLLFMMRKQGRALPLLFLHIHFLDLPEDRRHPLWQRLCVICLPGW